jgi:uncharacterized metal-binding protein
VYFFGPPLAARILDAMKHDSTLPLVYSCSGCSSAAQLANHVAVHLDRAGAAQMSCIAGVGGDVRSLVKVAKSGRPIIALDGCPLACVKHCLARHGLAPTWHIVLSELGVKKRYHADFDPAQAGGVLDTVLSSMRNAKR